MFNMFNRREIMDFKLRLDVIGFVLVGVVLFSLGIVYTFSSKIMPYHQEAMGSTWDNLSSGSQVMTINFMRSAAAGFLAYGFFTIVIAVIPLRNGADWAGTVLFIGLILEVLNVTYRTYSVSIKTVANPPLGPLIVVLILGTISYIFSFYYNRA